MKLYIFYPSNIIGGAELLLVRAAEALSTKYEICIVDQENGWLSQYVEQNNLNYQIVTFKKNKILIESNSIILTTANLLFKLDAYFSPSDAKILLWNVHPYNLIPSLPRLSLSLKNKFDFLGYINLIYFKIAKKGRITVLQDIINRNGIVVMDGANNNVIHKYLNLSIPRYIPVFIDRSQYPNSYHIHPSKKEMQVIWLGRLEISFKYYILEKLILDLNNYNIQANVKVKLVIVGTGDAHQKLINFAKKLPNLDIHFTGTLTGDQLNKTIQASKIGFAMGTSALELAIRKIPTILLDFSYTRISGTYHYKWIFQAENYDLGREIKYIDANSLQQGMSISSVLYQLTKEPQDIASKCYDYATEYHSIEHVINQLIDSINSSQLTLKHLKNYNKYKPFWIKLKNNLGIL